MERREREICEVTLWGSAGNVLLLVFKFVAAVVGQSSAMMADAVHSLSDFLTDIVVIVFVKMGAKPQDRSHDYGHGKFETFATLIIGVALIAAAISIIVAAAAKIADWMRGSDLEPPGMLALWAALVSIVVKEVLYQYTASRGRKLGSQAMIANAWHHRSDALSSVGSAIGIGGAIMLGGRFAVLDPVASIVVALMLLRVAYTLMKTSVEELTDGSLPDDVEQEITDIICSFPDISEPHNLRTRRIGNNIAIEAHIRMNGNMTLSQAHEIASAIEGKLKQRFGQSTHVGLHMEPKK